MSVSVRSRIGAFGVAVSVGLLASGGGGCHTEETRPSESAAMRNSDSAKEVVQSRSAENSSSNTPNHATNDSFFMSDRAKQISRDLQ